ERLAALLVTRAAAAFFLDSGAQDLLRDLHEAFRESPSGARRQLEAVLSSEDRERVRAWAQEAADVGFDRFQETVRSRAELREDSGRELLAPVACALRILLHVAPPRARPALGARLAECLLLAGDTEGARAICKRLLRPSRPGDRVGDRAEDRAGDRALLMALRGFCALHGGDLRRAQEDFQEVVEQRQPHPGGCVRALCGRGLLRVLAGSAFLGVLDYVTACRLRPEEALLVAKAYVPWNQRGLLLTALREEGRRMLQRRLDPRPLAALLMELDREDESSHLLAADALYRLGRLDDAHKALLVALSRRPQAAAVLARLALLQLHRGFSYDANQLVRKVVQSGDTTCLQPTLDIFHHEDRQLLWGHCHARALAILRGRPGGAKDGARTREAIAYLSLAIFAAGSQATESLLARARCYGFLGQKRTAMFDLNAVLRAEPRNVPALCGRALLHLALDQQKEAVDDILLALKLDPMTAAPEIRSLKPEAQALITQGLSAHGRALLSQLPDTGTPISHEDTQGLLAAGEKALQPTPMSEAARARRGLLQLKKGDVRAAVQDLQGLAGTDTQDLGFLLHLLDASERQGLAQAAAQEARTLLNSGQPGQALGYCSLAIVASDSSACHLRLRASCLAELGEFGQALRDLDRVLQEGVADSNLPVRAEDFCSRGCLLLSLGDEAGAAGAFTQALKLAPAIAQSSLWERPGRAPAAQVFLYLGQHCLEEQRYAEAWTAAESGLLVDPKHCGLKRLKARLRRQASSDCRLH
ncbi:hypothetical protein MC885_008863, partial [Smutsia gigantea]